MSEIYEKIIDNLEESYWNENLDDIHLTNRGYVIINGEWFTFGWYIGWGIVLSTIEKMDHIPDITKAFYMKDSKEYKKKYLEEKRFEQ